MAELYSVHSHALTALFDDIVRHADSQEAAFVGTAGSVVERKNADGFPFYVHQFYGGDGNRTETYISGPVGNTEADQKARGIAERIQELEKILPQIRMLGREGYQLAPPQTYASVASLANHGIFRAGGMLVGSHAFGVLLNQLGARSATYQTEDVDIARATELAHENLLGGNLLKMLNASGIDFVEIPSLSRKRPSTSFKKRGRSTFQVDLLVPSKSKAFSVVEVPELEAYATGLPYLDYLLEEFQTTALIARQGCCAVRVPLAERFAVHKMLVSQLRVGRGAKSRKDLFQAAVLAAVLGDTQPDTLVVALKEVPRSARKLLKPAISSMRDMLEGHPRALALL